MEAVLLSRDTLPADALCRWRDGRGRFHAVRSRSPAVGWHILLVFVITVACVVWLGGPYWWEDIGVLFHQLISTFFLILTIILMSIFICQVYLDIFVFMVPSVKYYDLWLPCWLFSNHLVVIKWTLKIDLLRTCCNSGEKEHHHLCYCSYYKAWHTDTHTQTPWMMTCDEVMHAPAGVDESLPLPSSAILAVTNWFCVEIFLEDTEPYPLSRNYKAIK